MHSTSQLCCGDDAGWTVACCLLDLPGAHLVGAVTEHTHAQPFYGPFSGTTRVSRCQKTSGLYGAKKDNKSRHTDNPARRHSMLTNQQPTSLIPPFLRQMPFLLQPSQFILAWDRHQVCWLAHPVAWLLWQNIWQIFAAVSVDCPLLCVVVDSSLWGVRLQQRTRDFHLHIAMFSCQLFCDWVNLYANTDIKKVNYFCRLTSILTAYFWLNLG